MADEAGRNLRPLTLHVPEPKYRPGDAVSFDDMVFPAAGSVARPPVDADPSSLRDLPYTLIRVLDPDGQAVGEWNPRLPVDRVVRILRGMMLTRIYDDRMFRAQRQGKTSFYMKCTGEEAVAVAAAEALHRDDMCFPSYRQQGLLIAREWSLVDMMCQVYSNGGDRLKGRQLPIMYSAKDAGFFSVSGNLGTQYPQAVGWAMASAAKGDTRIAASWVGEGTTAEGDFHAACTFASVFRAPVILNIVNNQWAISSFAGFAGGESTTFAARGLGYGIAALRVDGNDPLAVYAATEWAAERARTNSGATLIEHFTYRVEAHSTSDDPSAYRSAEDALQFPLGDPIERLKTHLIALGAWDEERHAALKAELTEQVRTAGREAEKLGVLSGTAFNHGFETIFEDVFETMPAHLKEQSDWMAEERRVAGV
jgi:2-oxoisovalerate dehydrogenase E1 component alpha subunit